MQGFSQSNSRVQKVILMECAHGKHIQPIACSGNTEPYREIKSKCKPQWGTMNVAQMLAHCSSFQDIAMGNSFPPRDWIGRIIGRFVKPIVYNDKPAPHNMSTIPTIRIADDRDFETEKERLKQKILTFQSNGPEKCSDHPHPFFGKLTPEQWGKGIYKHLDHHLRQFGV